MAMKSNEMTVLSSILSCRKSATPLMVVLVDPDKNHLYPHLYPYLSDVDMIFVGGSTGDCIEQCVQDLRNHTSAPIVLFPGNVAQFTPAADALLFITLLNSRRAEVLIEPHIQSAIQVYDSGIEVIPMGYILVDGDRRSSVEIVSGCTPIAKASVSELVRHAVAGQLLGKQLIYLEAGSGAATPVAAEAISAVRQHIDLPLIVGGGIVTPEQMTAAFEAGADVVVIGNHFEQDPTSLPDFIQAKKAYVR